MRFEVCKNTKKSVIQPKVEGCTQVGTTVYTDESHAYNGVEASGRPHHTVVHSAKEYARDDDGDGFCEVHCNTSEGIWTGLRNFLRHFRGVSKHYLHQYVAVFELIHNFKEQIAFAIRLFICPDYWIELLISP